MPRIFIGTNDEYYIYICICNRNFPKTNIVIYNHIMLTNILCSDDTLLKIYKIDRHAFQKYSDMSEYCVFWNMLSLNTNQFVITNTMVKYE